MRYAIGTRVRVVDRKDIIPEFIGMETAVDGFCHDYSEDSYFLAGAHISGKRIVAPHGALEPITKYDGNQLSTWDECVWQPGKVIASVLDNTEESRDD